MAKLFGGNPIINFKNHKNEKYVKTWAFQNNLSHVDSNDEE